MTVRFDVICAEGEKCADALHSIGLAAVTSISGSSSARQADWTPLRGMRVLIVPDRDEAGRRYAADVKGILEGLGCTVSAKEPPVKEGEDVWDFIEANKRRPRVWLRRMVT